MGEKIEMEPATEPSDIIWENQNIPEYRKFIKKIIVISIIVGLLIASFFVIYKVQRKAMLLRFKFPEQHCQQIKS